MSVVTLTGYRPSPRFDSLPWTEADVEEATLSTGPWAAIETFTLSPVDSDPSLPASRNFTTENASDTEGLWYRVVFRDASGDELLPTYPVQNVPFSAYATVDDLAAILKVNVNNNREALERVLATARYEIDSELGRAEAFVTPPDLAIEVNIERAVEHWQQAQSPFGIIGLGADTPLLTARDSWERHAHKLAPLKETWGLA